LRTASSLQSLKRENGFTLVELMVAMPLMLLVMGGLTIMLTTLTHWSSHTQEETSLQTESRAALNTLEYQLRGAFIGDGTTPITAATATSITFTTPDQYPATVAGTTLSSFHLLQVSYQVTGGMLQRQSKTSSNTYPTAPPWTFPNPMSSWLGVIAQANSITNTDVFTYYTQAGAQAVPPTPLTFPIADPSGVRAVGIKLTLSTGGSQPQRFTVKDIVALREMDN
jgi:prepilin-type N-terminal cleavage/methylation domain-containing protein